MDLNSCKGGTRNGSLFLCTKLWDLRDLHLVPEDPDFVWLQNPKLNKIRLEVPGNQPVKVPYKNITKNLVISFLFYIFTEHLKHTTMKPIECDLILHGSCKQISGGHFPSITAAKQWVKDCWDRPYTIVRSDKMKLSIPTFDDNLKFIKDVTIEINKKIRTEEYNRICNVLPGMCVGYCKDIYDIAETKKPIEITQFYDIRQRGWKKLKGYYIKVL